MNSFNDLIFRQLNWMRYKRYHGGYFTGSFNCLCFKHILPAGKRTASIHTVRNIQIYILLLLLIEHIARFSFI